MEELDLKELFYMFWSRKVHILIIVLIFIVIGITYSYVFVSPKYDAYTKLVLATSSEDATNSKDTITATDINLNNNLVSTYSEIMKSDTVMRKVIDNLNIDKTEGTLRHNVSVSAVKSTQVIQIDVIDSDPRTAKIVANELAKVFTERVKEIYKLNNVHILDEAKEPTSPYNINHIKDVAIFAFIGLVVSCAYVLIANMLDTTVKSQEDVERKLELTVLTTIPLNNFDDPAKNTKGGRK